MEEKDGRIKIINEVLNGIKVISYLKIQTAIYPLSIPLQKLLYFICIL